MSTILVNTLTGTSTAGSIAVTGEGNSTTTNLQQGLAKAWMSLNGTGTIALRDSFNISGVVDNGTGSYTPSYSSNFGNANYSASGAGGSSNSNANVRLNTPAAGSQDLETRASNDGSQYDEAYTRFTATGDLA
jgi:hypothetical protein